MSKDKRDGWGLGEVDHLLLGISRLFFLTERFCSMWKGSFVSDKEFFFFFESGKNEKSKSISLMGWSC